MATRKQRRGILYTTAVLAGAVLLFLGFGVTLPPDLGTRLSGAALLAGAGDYDKALEEVDLGIRWNRHIPEFGELRAVTAILGLSAGLSRILVRRCAGFRRLSE